VNYRALTDKSILEAPAAAEGSDESEAEAIPNDAEARAPQEDEEDADIEELEGERLIQLGKGFRAFLPGAAKKKRASQEPANTSTMGASSDGLCTVEGTVVDVKKVLTQLRKSEVARSEAESNLADANKNLNTLRKAAEKHGVVKDKLEVRKS